MTKTTGLTKSTSDATADRAVWRLVSALDTVGLSLTARDEKGNTWLHLIPRVLKFLERKPPLVPAFVAAGADVHTRNKNGETPLHIAAKFTVAEADIETLLAAGADPSARTEDDETPLHHAAWNVAGAPIVRSLVAAGADINARGIGDRTPLHLAARNPSVEVLATLISAAADLAARDCIGETPLHEAASCGNGHEVARALIAAGADVNARDNFEHTPLHGAANPEIVAALVDAGADINARDENGETPLQRATRLGKRKELRKRKETVVSALLAAGADPNPPVLGSCIWIAFKWLLVASVLAVLWWCLR